MDRTFAEEILKVRQAHQSSFPAKHKVFGFLDNLVDLLFPHLSGEHEYYTPAQVEGELALLERDLKRLLMPQQKNMSQSVDQVTGKFFARLPEIYRRLWCDARAIEEGDPAAESVDEVISAYPGFFAIFSYRVAHEFHREAVPIFPRVLAEHAHVRTGIDIHPGATIGDSLCIDHGTGIVIGESTVIGRNVKVYQGVSLGALSVSKGMAKTKRHPTIEDNVIVYSNATILGGATVIGHDSVIGGNVWLTSSVPAYSIVYHKAEIRVRSKQMDHEPIDFQI